MQQLPSDYTQIVTPTAQSPETTDNLIGATRGFVTGYSVLHDGANNPTVAIYDGTVAAGTLISEIMHTKSEVIRFPSGGLRIQKLSVKTTIGAGTATVNVFYRA